MSRNFRTEPVHNPLDPGNPRTIKVYAESNASLPVNTDITNRYGVFFPQGEQFLERIHNFEVRKDDVWVITMPKCGTTWMLELVWLLQNNLDYEQALKVEQEDRTPFLEYCGIFPSFSPQSIDVADKLKSPRVIKSHLQVHMLPKALWVVKPKIIYVARDSKDASVSYYHFLQGLRFVNSDKDEFFKTILRDEMNFSPFWQHVIDFWSLRNEPYIYFTSFERMKKDLRSVVTQVSEFLQKPLKDEQMDKLLEHLSFEKMKNNPACNHSSETKKTHELLGSEGKSFRFIRKGLVGGYAEDLTKDMIQKFDDWTEKALKPFNLTVDEILYS